MTYRKLHEGQYKSYQIFFSRSKALFSYRIQSHIKMLLDNFRFYFESNTAGDKNYILKKELIFFSSVTRYRIELMNTAKI